MEESKLSSPRIQNSSAAVLLRRELARRDLTSTQWAEVIGYWRQAARTQLKRLHALREIHMTDWTRSVPKGRWEPVYRLGDGRDAKKPAAQSTASRTRKQRERRQRERHQLAPSPYFAALFVVAREQACQR